MCLRRSEIREHLESFLLFRICHFPAGCLPKHLSLPKLLCLQQGRRDGPH